MGSTERFLIIDDSESFRSVVVEALHQMGYRDIEEAPDGAKGFNKIATAVQIAKPYTIVFCDIHMPGIDGLKLLEMLRADPKLRHTPVIMVTTEGSKQAVVRAAMAGIAGYIVKPMYVDDVKKKVQEVLKLALQSSP